MSFSSKPLDAYSRLMDTQTNLSQEYRRKFTVNPSTTPCDTCIEDCRMVLDQCHRVCQTGSCKCTPRFRESQGSMRSERWAMLQDEIIEKAIRASYPRAEPETPCGVFPAQQGRREHVQPLLCPCLCSSPVSGSGSGYSLRPQSTTSDSTDHTISGLFACLKSITMVLKSQLNDFVNKNRVLDPSFISQLRSQHTSMLEDIREQTNLLQSCSHTCSLDYQIQSQQQQSGVEMGICIGESFYKIKPKPSYRSLSRLSLPNVGQANNAPNTSFDRPLTGSACTTQHTTPQRSAEAGSFTCVGVVGSGNATVHRSSDRCYVFDSISKEVTNGEVKTVVTTPLIYPKNSPDAKAGMTSLRVLPNSSRYVIRAMTTVEDAREFHNDSANPEDAPPFLHFALNDDIS